MTRTFKIDGWTWHRVEPRLVMPWFADRERLRQENAVKGNELRDVFRVEIEGVGYYVKYHHPDSFLQRVRSGLVSKAKQEFNTARRLGQLGIPVAEPVGWGGRGSRSMLLTREVSGTMSAREYWFGPTGSKATARKHFLNELGLLLKRLLAENIYHPDFHLGNLLVAAARRTCQLTLVDVYGVTMSEPLDEKQRFAMLRMVGALRGELSRSEAIEFLRLHGLAASYRAADELWQKILMAEAAQMEHLWPKRRRKILAGHPKYAELIEIMGREWRIRRDLDGQLMLSPTQAEALDWRKSPYEVRHLSAAEAERQWLMSFRLSFHRLAHPQVCAWITADEEAEEILLIQRLDEPVVAEGVRRQELMDALHLAKVQIPEQLGNLVLHRGRAGLRDVALAEF